MAILMETLKLFDIKQSPVQPIYMHIVADVFKTGLPITIWCNG